MKKQIVLIITILAIFALIIISIYSTFAYNEEASKLGDSDADYNLIYSLSESNTNETNIASGQEKYLDLEIINTYKSNVKFGIYYELVNPKTIPEGFEIRLIGSKSSVDTLKPNEKRTVTVKINNNTDYNVSLIIGSLVGFENGDITELEKDNKILIK